MPRIKYIKLDSLARAALAGWRRDSPEVIAIDTESEGLEWGDRAFCVTITWKSGDRYCNHYIELDSEENRSTASLILSATPKWVFHNAKFDMQKLMLSGIFDRKELRVGRFEDTEALAHIDNPNRPKGLKFLAKELLGANTDETDALKSTRRKLKMRKSDGYKDLPREVVVPYAIKDSYFTYRLWEILRPRVLAHEELESLFWREMDLTLCLLDIEAKGMQIDLSYVREMISRHKSESLKLLLDIRLISGNQELNPDSPKQLIESFNKLGLDLDSTNKDTLLSLSNEREDSVGALAKAVLEYRRIKKLQSVYFEGILESCRGENILHPNLRQHGPATGRMASGTHE